MGATNPLALPAAQARTAGRALTIFVVGAALLCMALVLLVLPKFEVIFESFQCELPGLTKLYLGFGGLAIGGVLLMLVAASIAAQILSKKAWPRVVVPAFCLFAILSFLATLPTAMFVPLLEIMDQLKTSGATQQQSQQSQPGTSPTIQPASRPK